MEAKLTLFLLTLTSFLALSNCKSFNDCPDERTANVILGSAWVEASALEHTSLVRRVRLPQDGLYDQTISCLFATDMSLDDGGGDVEVTQGGVGHRYAELRLNSKIGRALEFLVIAYAPLERESAFTYEQIMTQ